MQRIEIDGKMYEVPEQVANYCQVITEQVLARKVQVNNLMKLVSNDNKEVLRLSALMRAAQKQYFKFREKKDLVKAMAAEEQYDKLMDRINGKPIPATQPGLFDTAAVQEPWIKEMDTQHLEG